jgi:Sec-independent protein secretion pathway component TatC
MLTRAQIGCLLLASFLPLAMLIYLGPTGALLAAAPVILAGLIVFVLQRRYRSERR